MILAYSVARRIVPGGWAVPAGTAFQQGDADGDLPECVTKLALILSVRLGGQAERREPHGGRTAGRELFPAIKYRDGGLPKAPGNYARPQHPG